ncbi:MAG: FG-GAP repeat protein [Actinobacteria bacterium]|nr:FG-GAP repeat protein [Actinomycetota bacterium]
MNIALLAPALLVAAASPRFAEGGARFGHSLATADVNGDGYADLIVAEPYAGASDAGRVLVYHGTPAGPAAAPAWTKSGGQAGAHFGASVGRRAL